MNSRPYNSERSFPRRLRNFIILLTILVIAFCCAGPYINGRITHKLSTPMGVDGVEVMPDYDVHPLYSIPTWWKLTVRLISDLLNVNTTFQDVKGRWGGY